MNIEIARTIQMLIIGTLVYIMNVSLGGFGEAWIAKKIGDSVPEDLGYKTLNPAPHFSFFWYAFMLSGLVFGKAMDFLQGVPGVGKFVPITPQSIVGKNVNVRVCLLFFARPIVHFLLFLISFLCLLVPLFSYMDALASMGVSPALLDTLRMISTTFYMQSIELFKIYCTVSLSRSILYFHFPHVNLFSMENMMMMFVLWFGIALFVTPLVIQALFSFLMFTGILDQNVMVGVWLWQQSIGI